MSESCPSGGSTNEASAAGAHRTDTLAQPVDAPAPALGGNAPVAAPPPAPTAAAPPPRGPLADDVYCIGCGYNLRGLSGEMIRCPECGDSTPAEVLEYPAALIRKYLRKLESHLALGVENELLLAQVLHALQRLGRY